MSYLLVRSPPFVKSHDRLLKKHPEWRDRLLVTLRRLAENPNDPALGNHKLRGRLRHVYSCTAGYDVRIMFRFVKVGDRDGILLLKIGTHDEVY